MYLFVNFPKWIDPFVINSLPIRWYSVMYLFAFATVYLLFSRQNKKEKWNFTEDDTSDLFLIIICFLLIGARVFSCLIYDDNRLYFLTRPWMMFWPFKNGQLIGLPGMSYHGGVVGVVCGIFIFVHKYNKKQSSKKLKKKEKPRYLSFFDISDKLLVGVPLGYTFGRLGNFFNGELWGRVTTSSVGMIFPNAEQFSTNLEWVRNIADKINMDYTLGSYINLPRYPSQLFEAFFEGIVLFLILWFIIKPISAKRKPGLITGSYLIGYGVFRFIIEYYREPDPQMGFVFSSGQTEPLALFFSLKNISMGQVLCTLMIIAGLLLIILTGRKHYGNK